MEEQVQNMEIEDSRSKEFESFFDNKPTLETQSKEELLATVTMKLNDTGFMSVLGNMLAYNIIDELLEDTCLEEALYEDTIYKAIKVLKRDILNFTVIADKQIGFTLTDGLKSRILEKLSEAYDMEMESQIKQESTERAEG